MLTTMPLGMGTIDECGMIFMNSYVRNFVMKVNKSSFIHRVRAATRKAEVATGLDELGQRARVLLDIIGENDDDPLRVSVLIDLAQLGTPPTMYKAITELERGGWIVRMDDRTDRRASLLRLSGKSKHAYAKINRQIVQLSLE